MRNRVTEHVRSNVVGYIALFCFAMGGTAWATHPGGANTISSGDIINNEVKSVDVANGEVKTDDIAANAVGSGKIADQQVKNADLGIGASSSNTIADGGIQGVDVMNNTLTGADIDESTLTGIPSTNAWALVGNAGTTAANFLGTTDNQPLNLRVNDARALRLEPASDGTNQSPNVIGGIADNSVTSGVHAATIGGGGRSNPGNSATANEVTDNYGTVGGGANNQAGDGAGAVDDREFATVGGGRENTANRFQATVGGGAVNTAGGNSATVGGGSVNTAGGGLATVSGGFVNTANGDFATVPGGDSNTAAGIRSFAAGTKASANHDGAFVWADSNPFDFASTAPDQLSLRSTGGARLVSGIDASGDPTSGLELPAGTSGWSTLVNGQPFDVSVNGSRGLRIDPASDGTDQSPNVISGTGDNSVSAGVHSATIAGGGRGTPSLPGTANRVTDHQGAIGGGANNQAGNGDGNAGDRTLATVSGGGNNNATGESAAIGGGFSNNADGRRATVSGGAFGTASGEAATVGGGSGNDAGAVIATVGGGFDNTITASGEAATVAGGQSNTANGEAATVAGGFFNAAAGGFATVVGGDQNSAVGSFSLAGGRKAVADDDGAFVWADSSNTSLHSTAPNQFSVRSSGGARFISAINPSNGAPTAGVELAPGGGAWSSLSDEASKQAIEPVSGREVLRELASVPISTWSYRSQDESIRHIGPMAQDFFRAFGVGEARRHISSVDADGVALAAIKGLHRQLRAERQRRHEQERRLARLEARLAALERR